MDKVRIGIIGCGGIANGKHMPSLKKLADVEMVAFCDIIVERAVKARQGIRRRGRQRYTPIINELIARDESIDVVHVLTPNREHSQITVDAHQRGQACNVRKAHGHQLRRSQGVCWTTAKAHRQEADHRLSEPLQRPDSLCT